MNDLDRYLSNRDGGRILDLATGDGEFLEIVLGRLRSFDSALGIDIDENLLSDARRALSSRRVRFRCADAHDLPLESERFDTITVSNALHHFDHPVRVLSEAARVAKPEGVIIIREMVADALSDSQQVVSDLHEIKAAVDRLLGIPHGPTLTRTEILRLVREADLETMSTFECLDEDQDAHNPIHIELRLEFVFSYLEHIAGYPEEYAALRRRAFRIKEQIYRAGATLPPELVIVAVPHRHSEPDSVYLSQRR